MSAAAARADTDRACADICARAACMPPRDVACTAARSMHQAAVPTQRAGVRGASCALEHSPSRRRVLCLAFALVSATVPGTAVARWSVLANAPVFARRAGVERGRERGSERAKEGEVESEGV